MLLGMYHKDFEDFKKFISGKHVTLMGLGVLGRGINVAKFLAECGARLSVTDLKTKEELAPALKELKKFDNITYTLGEHKLFQFRNADMIIKAAGVPLDSPYIKEAKKYGVPVEMDASLFAKFTNATLVGVTGTRGKSTVSYLIYEILKKAKLPVYLAGNIRGTATLPLLKKAKKGDYVVLELDSWQLQGFGTAKISPHIAVFTNIMHDHMNYYKGDMKAYWNDKANIFKYQTKGDVCITSVKLSPKIKTKGKKVLYKKSDISKDWDLKLLGEHNKENIAAAIKVGEVLGIPHSVIQKGVENFSSIPGRLQKVRTYKGIDIYNDTNATTPDATRAALASFKDKSITLICGGTDKNLSYKGFGKEIAKKAQLIVFLEGTATEKIVEDLPKTAQYEITNSLKKAVFLAVEKSKKGNVLLFSPAAASFGLFKNEYDRGDQFLKIVKGLK